MPPKFFITHSWKDIEFARRLTDDLRANGLDGFFDAYSIKPGDLISKEISDGLEKCDIYVPILSHASLKSPWCEEEIHAAITLSKFPGRAGRPRIIPILVEDCQDAMPVLLRTRLYIMFDGRYHSAFDELLTKGFGVPITPPTSRIITPPPLSQVTEEPSLPILKPVKLEIPSSVQFFPRTFTGKAGMEMVLIPAGEFLMGSNEGKDDEKPLHQIYLDTFYIARYPVTNVEYKKFLDATKHNAPEHWSDGQIPKGKETHPVVKVTWNDATAYAQWAGARLPTEAEWEKAASWDEVKKVKRVYPWGNRFYANKCNSSQSGINDTTTVDKYSPQGDSVYGVSDMAGNVWEWCADWYDGNYYENSPTRNPKGPDSGSLRVWRGGSWLNQRGNVRAAYRNMNYPVNRTNYVGFRVVVSSSLNS